MKLGNFKLTQGNLIIAAFPALAVIAVVSYVIFYAPLMGELKAKYPECRTIETEVLECRNTITSAGKVYTERVLTTEKDVSYTIDELTKHGRSKGINFISMNPKRIRKEEDLRYKILPIEMGIESTYEKLGVFLGSLDELKGGLIKVKSFDITPDEEPPSKLATELVVDLYLSGRQDER